MGEKSGIGCGKMVLIGKQEIRVQCGRCRGDLSYIGNLSLDDMDMVVLGCPTKDCGVLVYLSPVN